jgi:hypothetical protein
MGRSTINVAAKVDGARKLGRGRWRELMALRKRPTHINSNTHSEYTLSLRLGRLLCAGHDDVCWTNRPLEWAADAFLPSDADVAGGHE